MVHPVAIFPYNDADGFSKKYSIHDLLYYEIYQDPKSAIEREKQIKSWSRKKKDALIVKFNPKLKDLWKIATSVEYSLLAMTSIRDTKCPKSGREETNSQTSIQDIISGCTSPSTVTKPHKFCQADLKK